jgi:putative membrane protein
MVPFHFVWMIGFLFMLVVVIGVVLLLTGAFRSRPLSPATAPPMGETPLQILDRRFAAGEIDAEEYQRARDLLGGGGKS